MTPGVVAMAPDRGSATPTLTEHEIALVVQALLPDARDHGREWRAACNVHGGDNREALAIQKATGNYYCHTRCNRGGNLFELVRQVHHSDFPEALKTVSGIIGRDLCYGNGSASSSLPPWSYSFAPPAGVLPRSLQYLAQR